MRLALGTVQFGLRYGIANQGGQVGHDEANRILAVARTAGISTLDTAIAYGDSEACLGALGVRDFRVITKLPPATDVIDDTGRWVREHVAASLARLRIPSLHGLLLHRSQQLLGPRGQALVAALEQLKAGGVVERVGVSIYSPNELEPVMNVCTPDIVQAPFNLLDRRLLKSGWLARLARAGVAIHARSVFLQGLLLMPAAAIPAKFAPWRGLWDTWHDWLAGSRGVSAAAACIGFVQSFPEVEKVVVGVDSAGQLEQIVEAAAARPMTDWPAVDTADERLIDPSNWPSLQ
mgnify:CR=1 FL=1